MHTETNTYDSSAFALQALSSPAELAAVLDHTLLKPDATRAQVVQLCHEAAEHRFACAMVNPIWVSLARSVLSGTGIPVDARSRYRSPEHLIRKVAGAPRIPQGGLDTPHRGILWRLANALGASASRC